MRRDACPAMRSTRGSSHPSTASASRPTCPRTSPASTPGPWSASRTSRRPKPTLARVCIKTYVLKAIAGVHARRLWDEGMQASAAATLAGVKALADAGIDPDKVGLLVNTSVSRDYLEPATASIVSGNLGLGDECQKIGRAHV